MAHQLSSEKQLTSAQKIARDRSKNKAKGKENAAKLNGSSAVNAAQHISRIDTSVVDLRAMKKEELEWDWTTLADSSTGLRPAVFTADGNYFFSVVGTTVRIYSVETGRVVSTLSSSSIGSSGSRIFSGEGHSDLITAAILNPENPFQLITASLDGNIKIWDFIDAELLQTINIGSPISHMCAHDKFKGHVFIAVLTKLKKYKKPSSALDKGNTLIYRVSLTPKQGSSLGTFSSSEIIRFGKTKAALAMAVSPSGLWLVLIAGQKAYVSSTSSPDLGFTKFVSPEKLTCLTFHPTEDYFATGDEQGQIRLWYCLNTQISLGTGGGEKRAQTTMMHWHAHAVSSLAFTSNGAYLLSGGEERVLVMWQIHSAKKEFIPRLGSAILSITVRPGEDEEEYLLGLADGSYIFISSGSLSVCRSISRIRLDPTGSGRPLQAPLPLASHIATSTIVLPASHPSSLQIYSPATSSLISELEVSPSNRVSRRDNKEIEASRVEFVSISSNGNWMATIDRRENEEAMSAEVYLKIWRWTSTTWVLNTRIDSPHGSSKIVSMDFAPCRSKGGDELLMTAGWDRNVKTWSIRSVKSKGNGTEDFWINRSCFSFRSETPSDASWSPDGSLLAVSFGRRTVALYDPYFSVLLDCLVTTDIQKIDSVNFVGRSGRYLLTSGKRYATLWDLVTHTVRWTYHPTLEIAHVLPHKINDLIAIIVRPFAEEGDVRISKVLLFSPSSSNPYSIRTLPFRFRNVIWNNLDKDSCNLVGITYQWNVVLCGDDVRISTGDESQSREIDRNASAIQKKTLFQDMFGKSAFVDISNIRDSTLSPTQKPTEISSASSIFDSPAYQSPSVDSLYSSLMTCFLSKVSQSPEEVKVPEEQLLEMDVDMETGPSIPQGRIVDDDEVNSLVDLFRTQSINNPQQSTNGIHHIPNGIVVSISTPKPTKINGIAENLTPRVQTPTKQDSSPVMVGKKRKKV